VLLWVQDPDLLDVTLAQPRAASFGIDELTFVTRDGIRSLINQAAGIVIALLVAFSLVAVGAAVMMLSAARRPMMSAGSFLVCSSSNILALCPTQASG